jgi:hypothetical protein
MNWAAVVFETIEMAVVLEQEERLERIHYGQDQVFKVDKT